LHEPAVEFTLPNASDHLFWCSGQLVGEIVVEPLDIGCADEPFISGSSNDSNNGRRGRTALDVSARCLPNPIEEARFSAADKQCGESQRANRKPFHVPKDGTVSQ
jgi:hypothetical protein